MNLSQVKKWARSAAPGSAIIYRTGKQLAAEPKKHEYPEAVHAVRHLYNQGRVHLVQRRSGDGLFDYIAVKRDRIAPPLPAFAKTGEAVHLFSVPPSILARM